MDLGEGSVEAIRERSRNTLILNRQQQKVEDTDMRRLARKDITPEQVLAIANKLRTSVSISADELALFNNALINDGQNVKLVLNSDNNQCLKGLVRELSGTDVEKRILAANSFCNLAYSDHADAGNQVVTMAGPYLVAALDFLNPNVMVPCAWTIANIALLGKTHVETLVSLGAIDKLAKMILGGKEVSAAAMHALERMVFILENDLSIPHHTIILKNLLCAEVTQDSTHLLFYLTCHTAFNTNTIPLDYITKLLEAFKDSVEKYGKLNESFYRGNIPTQLKVLGNMFDPIRLKHELQYLKAHSMAEDFKNFKDMEELNEIVQWYLGNMNVYLSNDFDFEIFFQSCQNQS